MKIELPKSAELIINELERCGHEAYAVGGCVRDAVMGKTPHDWDITTSAKPEEIKKIFNKTVDTGIEHGTVTVIIKGTPYEVTTYRIDGEYEDGRHPDEVMFTSSLTEDLKRRDFTINAMAYNPGRGLVDIFGGIDDINGRIIRCVGNPYSRFSEDALRMMRAVRFAAQLDFEIESETYRAVMDMAGNLKKISVERIRSELDRLLISKRPEKILMLRDMGIISVIIPEFTEKYLSDEIWKNMCGYLSLAPEDRHVRWACFLYDNRKECRKILKALKLDNKTIDAVNVILEHVDDMIQDSEACVRRNVSAVYAGVKDGFGGINRSRTYEEYIMLRETLEKYSGYNAECDCTNIGAEKLRAYYKKIVDEKHCLSIGGLNINGADLKELGIEPGKQMGEILNKLLDMVMENPELNTFEFLSKSARNLLS